VVSLSSSWAFAFLISSLQGGVSHRGEIPQFEPNEFKHCGKSNNNMSFVYIL